MKTYSSELPIKALLEGVNSPLLQNSQALRPSLLCFDCLDKVAEHFVFDVLLQSAKFIQLFTTFLGGYIVAFIKSWKLTLVVMSIMPVIVIAGGTTAVFISKMSNRSQAAYAEAGTLVEQVVGSIRTVSSNSCHDVLVCEERLVCAKRRHRRCYA